jgi:alkylmercury lyase
MIIMLDKKLDHETRAVEKDNFAAVDRGINFIRQHEEFKLVPVLVGLLAQGEPVSVERLASEGGWPEDEVRTDLARHPSVEWDDQGRIAGFGLTLRPTPHRFEFDGKTVYGWCASDALSFPVLLEKPGIVSSTCPVTGQTIRVEVTPEAAVQVDPPGAVVSSVRPTGRVKDVRAEICGLGHFFSSREAASAWLAEYPDGFLHSVAEDFEVHRQVLAELGWTK